MKKRITQHLINNNSYFKWGVARLAEKFNCSERTIKSVMNTLTTERRSYLTALKNN